MSQLARHASRRRLALVRQETGPLTPAPRAEAALGPLGDDGPAAIWPGSDPGAPSLYSPLPPVRAGQSPRGFFLDRYVF